MPDAASKGQSECSADDNSQHRAADVAPADAGAEGTGQAESNQDGDEGDGHTPQGGRGSRACPVQLLVRASVGVLAAMSMSDVRRCVKIKRM